MDNCIVCLELNDDYFSRITMRSSEWIESSIQRIIEKHLWWWYLKKSNKDKDHWICRQCWQELSSFHQFYCKVENAHKQNELIVRIKTDIEEPPALANNEEEISDVKGDIKLFDFGSSLNEELIPVMKRKRNKKKKIKPAEEIKLDDSLLNPSENSLLPESSKRKRKQLSSYTEIAEPAIVQVKQEENELDLGENLQKHTEENETDFVDEDDWDPNTENESSDTDDGDESYNGIGSNEDDKMIDKSTDKKKRRKRKPKPDALARQEARKKDDEFLTENKFPFFCNICNVEQTNFKNLRAHFRNEHKVPGYAMCCNLKMRKRSDVVDHVNVHKDPNYFRCQFCHKVLATRRTLEVHLGCVHKAGRLCEFLFNCDKCDKSFHKQTMFDRHQLLHLPDEDKKFQCNDCKKRFPTESHLKTHLTRTHAKKYHQICDICGKSLRNKFTMTRHMAEHNGTPLQKVSCDICGLELSTKYRLNRHKKMRHMEENLKEQQCPYCSKISPNLNAHQHHIRNAHTAPRRHACHLCDKKFKRPVELKEHISTHTGEMLYSCLHCSKAFRSIANLHKHRKQAHRKEWEEARVIRFSHQNQNVPTYSAADNANSSNFKEAVLESYAHNLMMASTSDTYAKMYVK